MRLGTLYLDVYRDGFLIRRENLGDSGGVVVIGSAGDECQVWLDSARVAGRHALIEVSPEGRVLVVDHSSTGTFIGRRKIRREELWRNAPIGIPPFVLVLSKRPLDPDPGPPPRNFPPLPPPPAPKPLPKPEPGPADRSCPRCESALADRDLPATGPAFRTAPTRALACSYCDVAYWSADAVATRMPLAGRLSATRAVRRLADARGLCPACRHDLRTVQLAWGADWVDVEECDHCGLVGFGPGEIDTVSRIMRAIAQGG